MSIKWCPTPPFEQCKWSLTENWPRIAIFENIPWTSQRNTILSWFWAWFCITDNVGTSFCGPIISLFAPEKGLFHALDIDLFEKFQEFEQHVPTLDLYTEPPKFGEIFLFVNQHQKCYRAYRLNSNRTNMNSIRALLFDVGTEFYINFKKGSFYKMPESFFKTQAMAIFCYAESFPSVDGGQIKSEFLKQSVYKNFKYLIQKSMNIECASGNKKCLVVSVLDTNENEDDQLDSHSTMNETLDETLMQPIDNIPINSASRLTSPIKAKSYPNLTYCDDDNFIIALDSKFPEPGERIMICPTQITTPNTLYAHYIKDLTKKLSSDAMSLFIWMNTSSVVKGYRKLKTKPNVGDIVLVFGRNSFFHLNFYRGRVTDNTKELFPVMTALLPDRFE